MEEIPAINWELKKRIVEKFGTQAGFALIVKIPEPDLSAIIQGRKEPPEDVKAEWANLIGCKVIDIFPG